MNDTLKIESILGVVASENHLRASRDGIAFEGMLPAPTWTEETVKRSGSVTDTVEAMRKLIKHYAWQTRKIAPMMKGKNLHDTCNNIWNFLFEHFKYKEDDKGEEQLRTPSRSFAQRRTRGIDCDDFTIFAGSLLYNLGIPFYIRIARYPKKDYFQHVYNAIPQYTNSYIVIDGVLDQFDAEKTPAETKDFLVMNTNNFSGIDISVLGGIDDEQLNEISGILTGEDFKTVNDLEGLGTIASREDELGAIKNFLIRTRGIVARRPEMVRDVENAQSFLGMVDYALKYWDTNKREEALGVLEGEENRMNELEGLGDVFEGHEDVELFYGLNSLGSYDVLGKAKRQRKFFSKVKQAVKKAGQGIKKVAKALIRFNPLTATIRAAVLLALKVNLMKVSSKLKWGYLTEEEARAQNFDINEWRKVKTQLAKAEGMFVKILQGKAENFKRAILSGRAGKLSGTDLGLGVVATAATAASTTAAVPFITKIINLLKKINFKKLIAKVNPEKLMRKKKKAEKEEPTEEGGSAMPEGGEATETPPEPEPANEENTPPPSDENEGESETTSGSGTGAKTSGGSGTKTPAAKTTPTDTGETESGSESDSNTDNLPANNARGTAPAAKEDGTQQTFMDKAVTWVKENKGTSILIAAGAAFLIYQAVKPPSRQLTGTRRGKKKSGKKKSNPPKTVTGKKRKGRGKGGSGKRVTL